MRPAICTAALATAAHALVARDVTVRDTGCCFSAKAIGGPGGQVKQLDDGQNRVGDSSLEDGQYCISSTGGLTDRHGRGCILTPPTKQWQCDAGASPTSGFSIASDGALGYKSSSQFYACPTGQNGGYNLYTASLDGEPGCVPVKLMADNCLAEKPSSNNPAPPANQCPANLPKDSYEFPHLIVPINENDKTKFYGTSYNGTAGGGISSIFNFDIPATAKGKTCKLQFLFPKQNQLETSAYTISGPGTFKFATLKGVATTTTTYSTSPKVSQDFGEITMRPGGAYNIASVGCPAGEAFSVWFHALGDSYLDFFQDYNPCPIGLYIIVA